jgi:ABC-type sugar transport system ATPase subunit
LTPARSTVVNCLAGVHRPTAGRILLSGAPVQLSSPIEARGRGVEAIFQDLALADLQPVYMNVFLGRELVLGPPRRLDRDAMAAETARLLGELNVRAAGTSARVRPRRQRVRRSSR